MRLVYAAPVPYLSFAQRPHHIVTWINERSGDRTLWINPYPGRLPRLSDLMRPRLKAHRQGGGRVEILSPPQWGADPLLAASSAGRVVWKRTLKRVRAFVEGRRWLLLIGRPSLLALHLLRTASPTISAYDAMDDFPEFYSGCSRALSFSVERRIASRVNTVLVSSSTLQQKFDRLGVTDVELLRNGLNGKWPQTSSVAIAQPVFGYVGTIGPWFDWMLVHEMARSLTDVRFEIVGPVMTQPAAPLPDNVHLAGECAHQDVPKRLLGFTAGLIPFKANPLTESVDPIKYYEYRAAGLPVLCTAFGDMRYRTAEPSVHLIHHGMDFPALRKHLEAQTPNSLEELARFRSENAWHARFKQSPFLQAHTLSAVRQGASAKEDHSSR